ncbi:DUF5944 family protein [Paenibacillus wynnii]|nr:DUF5944 family protein [Paenibacillus wynnii]
MSAFEQTSMSNYGTEVICTFDVSEMGPEIIKVKGCLNLHSAKGNEDLLSKATVYFPERKYAIEFIKQSSIYTIEFVCEKREPKEYFNLVLSDKNGYIFSSTTYVFNASNIVAYPVMEKDISPYSIRSEIKESDGRLVFKTITGPTVPDEQFKINHIWQNVGQHVLLSAQRNSDNVFESSLLLEDMCSGVWMVIATDQEGKLMTQYVLQV